eukprot:3403595-Prymnesium_polylepis.2
MEPRVAQDLRRVAHRRPVVTGRWTGRVFMAGVAPAVDPRLSASWGAGRLGCPELFCCAVPAAAVSAGSLVTLRR